MGAKAEGLTGTVETKLRNLGSVGRQWGAFASHSQELAQLTVE